MRCSHCRPCDPKRWDDQVELCEEHASVEELRKQLDRLGDDILSLANENTQVLLRNERLRELVKEYAPFGRCHFQPDPHMPDYCKCGYGKAVHGI